MAALCWVVWKQSWLLICGDEAGEAGVLQRCCHSNRTDHTSINVLKQLPRQYEKLHYFNGPPRDMVITLMSFVPA